MKITPVLTQSAVNAFLTQFDGVRKSISDGKVRGLQLERLGRTKGRWRLRFRDTRNRRCCYTIGDAPTLTLAQARQLAEALRQKVFMGINPAEQKRAQAGVPTFSAFISDQYMPHVKSYKRSWETDASTLKNHLLPCFGSCYMDEITRQDIVKMLATRRESGAAPGSVNKVLILLRFIFNLALRWELPGVRSNPTKNIPLAPDSNKKERYLSEVEAARLYEAVCESENTMLRYIVPMLILTGARKREVLDAKWEDFDLERRLWRIPTTKLGKPRYVPLSEGVLNLLATIPRYPKSNVVFANPKTGKPYVTFFVSWNTARTKARLSDVRVHDLRHSFASLLINSGRSLYEVQKLLGHTQIKTTQRYAHLSPETLLEATNAASRAVGSVMGVMPNRGADVPLVAPQG